MRCVIPCPFLFSPNNLLVVRFKGQIQTTYSTRAIRTPMGSFIFKALRSRPLLSTLFWRSITTATTTQVFWAYPNPDIEKWSSSYRTSTSLTAWHRTKRWISVWSIWKWGSETRSENFWWTELLVLCLYCAYVSYCRGIFQQIEGDVGSASGVTDVFRSHFFQRWSWSSCLFTCMIMYSSVANLIKAFHVFFFHPSTERKLCQLMVLTPLIVPLVPPFEVETTCQWGFFFIFIFSKSLGDV